MKFNKQTVRCKTTCFIWVAIMQRMIGVVNNITTPQHTVLRTFKRNRVKETLVAAVLFSCGLCIYEVHFYSRWWYPGYSSGFLVRLPGFKFRYGRYFRRLYYVVVVYLILDHGVMDIVSACWTEISGSIPGVLLKFSIRYF